MTKILFLCNQLPNNFDAGGILYSEIIKNYGVENFFFLSLVHPIKITEFNISSKKIINQYSFTIPRTNIFLKSLRKLPLLDTIYISINLFYYKSRIIKSVKNENFDIIFAPLRGEVLLILLSILNKTKLPLYAMVEDTVEAEVFDSKIFQKIKSILYYKLLKRAVSLGVAGESMREYFKINFNLDSIILRPSYEFFSNAYPKKITNELNIIFAGNTYAKKELNLFIEALEKFSLIINMPINFYIASHTSFFTHFENLKIHNLSWLPQKELKKYMDICHIAYLPYRSELKFKHQMKYAFPGKSGLYISNNLPIFFHGPSYSSFNIFLKTHRVGVSCDSLDPEVVFSCLSKFVNDPALYLNSQKACQYAFNNVFSNQIFIKNVTSFFKLNNLKQN